MADYYLDFDHGTALTGTVTFTNASDVLSGSGTLFLTELAVGNYVMASAGVQWYKVTAITDDLTATISPAFQQATVTDTTGASLVNAGDGSTANPFCHLCQYTTDTVRSPGDRLFVQNGQTHVYAGIDIVFDEDGTAAAYIEILNSDWNATGSTAKPIVDFGGTNSGFNSSYDYFWYLKNFAVTGNTDYALETGPSDGSVLDGVDFYGNVTGFYGNNFYGTGKIFIKNSSYYNNSYRNLYFQRGFVDIDNCDIDGGKVTGESSDYGLYVTNGCVAYVKDTVFGQTIPHDLYDIYCDRGGIVILNNCLFDVTKTYVGSPGDYITSYNHNQVKDAYWSKFYNGIVEKDTVTIRTGGATSSIKVTPNANCTGNVPLLCAEWQEYDVAAAATTRTVYIDVEGIATTFPTATQLWLEAEYYDAATGATTAKAVSTDVLTTNSTWTAFSVTFTPGQAGRVVYRVYIAYYEGAETYYVDNQLN